MSLFPFCFLCLSIQGSAILEISEQSKVFGFFLLLFQIESKFISMEDCCISASFEHSIGVGGVLCR